MTASSPTKFSRDDRALLAKLADELIPAGDGMPSASQADVQGKWLDVVLQARSDLETGLRHLLALAKRLGEPTGVARLKEVDANAFNVLAEVASGAYFLNPDVRKAIKYEGQAAQQIDRREDYRDDGLLDSVIGRGPIYRPTPDG